MNLKKNPPIDFIIRDLQFLRRQHPWMRDTLTVAIKEFELKKERQKNEES